jgi:crotonobetaine/carnitine-CoA ligase
MIPETNDHVLAWCALSKIGAVDVPVNTAYKGAMLIHVINDSHASVIVCHARFLEQLMAVADDLTRLQTVIMVNPLQEEIPAAASTRFNLVDFSSLPLGDDGPLPASVVGQDPMSIIYTSGTTGPSKGVMVSHIHASQYAHTCQESKELSQNDVYYTSGLPFFHVAGRWGGAYSCLQVGAALAVPEGFSVSCFWEDVERFDATVTFMLGAVASLIYRKPPSPSDNSTSLAKVAMVPLIPEHREFARRFDVRISTSYGSTECGAPAIYPMGKAISDRRIVGPPKAALYDVAILDERDDPVDIGEVGEICVRPKRPWITMLGYWNRPEDTAWTWRNLWLHTGDAGMYDADGNLYFIDRIKDCIRRRGENISSAEVEAVIVQHPGILECAIYPVPSELTEDDIMAALVLRPGDRLDPVELIDFAARRLPYFMVPRYLELFAELPKTATGKVSKQQLRDRGTTSETWDAVAAGVKMQGRSRVDTG